MTKRFLSAVLLTLAVCPFNAAEIFTGYDIDAIVAKMSLSPVLPDGLTKYQRSVFHQ